MAEEIKVSWLHLMNSLCGNKIFIMAYPNKKNWIVWIYHNVVICYSSMIEIGVGKKDSFVNLRDFLSCKLSSLNIFIVPFQITLALLKEWLFLPLFGGMFRREWKGISLIAIPFMPTKLPNNVIVGISLKDPFYPVPFHFWHSFPLFQMGCKCCHPTLRGWSSSSQGFMTMRSWIQNS